MSSLDRYYSKTNIEAICPEVQMKFLIFDVFQNSEKMAGKIGPHLFEVIYPEARNVKIMVGKII